MNIRTIEVNIEMRMLVDGRWLRVEPLFNPFGVIFLENRAYTVIEPFQGSFDLPTGAGLAGLPDG
jgi:hypothetical protein